MRPSAMRGVLPPLFGAKVLWLRDNPGWSLAMANKEQHGNREKRKPKKEKPKPAPHISTFSGATSGATMKSAAGKKSHG